MLASAMSRPSPRRLSQLLLLLAVIGIAGALTPPPAQAGHALQSDPVVQLGSVMERSLAGNLSDAATIHEYHTAVGIGKTLVVGVIARSPGLTLRVNVFRREVSAPDRQCSHNAVTDRIMLCYRSNADDSPVRVQVSASAGTGDYTIFARGMGTYASGSSPQLTIDDNADTDTLLGNGQKAFVMQASQQEMSVRLCLSTSTASQLGLIKARAYDNTGTKVCQENGVCARLSRNRLYYVFTINTSTTQVNGVRVSLERNAC